MKLQDGTGTTDLLTEVNKANQLITDTEVISAYAYAAENGDAYSWTAVTADINDDDSFLEVINQSRTRLLYITKVYVWADVPITAFIHVPAACTWITTTPVVGVNQNRLSTKTADAVAYSDDTTMALAAANVIKTIHTREHTDYQSAESHDFEGAVILGYDDAIAVDGHGESAAFNVSIYGYFTDM